MADPRAGSARPKSRAGIWLLVGLVVGALGAIFLPDLAAPYLPDALRAERVEVDGIVEAKDVSSDRLLLTVSGPEGATLITYTGEIAEIGLLVEEGDSVRIGLDAYSPFATDAPILRVRKPRAEGAPDTVDAGPPDEVPAPAPPAADTANVPAAADTAQATGAAGALPGEDTLP